MMLISLSCLLPQTWLFGAKPVRTYRGHSSAISSTFSHTQGQYYRNSDIDCIQGTHLSIKMLLCISPELFFVARGVIGKFSTVLLWQAFFQMTSYSSQCQYHQRCVSG